MLKPPNRVPPKDGLFIFTLCRRLFFKCTHHIQKCPIRGAALATKAPCPVFKRYFVGGISFAHHPPDFTAPLPFKGGRNNLLIIFGGAPNFFRINAWD